MIGIDPIELPPIEKSHAGIIKSRTDADAFAAQVAENSCIGLDLRSKLAAQLR